MHPLLPESPSEPTKTVTNEHIKLEASARLSNEKSHVHSNGTVDVGSFPLPNGNGSIGDNARSQKTTNGVVSGGPYIVNSPLNPLTNGRRSSGSYSVGSTGLVDGDRGHLGSQGSSKHKEVQNQQGQNGVSAQTKAKGIDGVLPPSPDRSTHTKTQPPSSTQTRTRRAQSASNPGSPVIVPANLLEPAKTESRISSPSAYDTPVITPNNQSSSSPHPGTLRLQHRHTLQVPKPAPTRVSRDFSFQNGNASEDAIATGFSSSSAIRRSSLNLVRRNTRSVHSDVFLEEVPQDADAARWAETVKQKRASRRKRKEEEEDDRVMVGTKVDQNHVNWVTAYNMLTGIRFTVSRTNAKMDRELEDLDFDAKHKFSFDITGNELTPSAKYDFKFKDYAPWVFRHLRAKFYLDPADYLISLTSKYILSELGSPGKSGSFFYFSRDYKYIIKTIHHAEHKLLRKVLRDYYAHIENNPNTLISQFYGLHRVKIPYGRKIHFVVMNNLFPPHRDIHSTFDLKGSTIGRNFREEDLESNPRATLKDLNWLRRNNHLELGPAKKQMFIEQMRRDVELLQKLKIMDYSLLVGIHDVTKGNEEGLRDKTLQVFQPGGEHGDDPKMNALVRTPSKLESARKARELRQIIKKERPVPMDQSTFNLPTDDSKKRFYFYSDDGGFQATHENETPGEEIYYLGIIDCLTHYGFVKRMEHFWKGLSNNKNQISPIPPEAYGDRYLSFISGITMPREAVERQAAYSLDNPGASTTNRHSNPPMIRTSSDVVMDRAERQAEMTERHGASEGDIPDRTLRARSNSADRGGSANATATLPVVEEVGESGSVGGRSRKSTRSARSARSREPEEEFRPQDLARQAAESRSLLPPPVGGRPPPTPPKDNPREKQLPLLPTPTFADSPITFDTEVK